MCGFMFGYCLLIVLYEFDVILGVCIKDFMVFIEWL